jgi:hypothetical protein
MGVLPSLLTFFVNSITFARLRGQKRMTEYYFLLRTIEYKSKTTIVPGRAIQPLSDG